MEGKTWKRESGRSLRDEKKEKEERVDCIQEVNQQAPGSSNHNP